MRHPQAVAAEELWALGQSVADPGLDIDQLRAEEHAAGLLEPRDDVASVVDVDADGVACRLYRPAEGTPLVIHLHGGGFVFGDLETHDAHARRLANVTGWAVLSVDYRRAPEHRYPAASDDVDRVVDWVGAHGDDLGVDTSRLSVVGDSAGGQLAFVAALRRQVFESAVFVYPCVDPRGAQPSYRTEDGGLTPAEMDWFWSAYLAEGSIVAGELDAESVDVSALPPTLVITAEHDPLRDEGHALAARIDAAGVDSDVTCYLGMIHGFFRHPELFDASDVAMSQVAAWLTASR